LSYLTNCCQSDLLSPDSIALSAVTLQAAKHTQITCEQQLTHYIINNNDITLGFCLSDQFFSEITPGYAKYPKASKRELLRDFFTGRIPFLLSNQQ